MTSIGFQFEQDFIASLRCIPMVVRYKLDTAGVKLKLSHWHRFSQEERRQLAIAPCEDDTAVQAYREQLQAMVVRYFGQPAKTLDVVENPPWLNEAVPAAVAQQAAAHHLAVPPERWRQLTPLQRFVLIKLSRAGHENINFVPAMEEFGLGHGATEAG